MARRQEATSELPSAVILTDSEERSWQRPANISCTGCETRTRWKSRRSNSVENQIDRLKNYPELRNWAHDHVEAAKQHRELIKQCIERRGGSTSTIKDVTMAVMGKFQELTGAVMADEVLKNVIGDYLVQALPDRLLQSSDRRRRGSERSRDQARLRRNPLDLSATGRPTLALHCPSDTRVHATRRGRGDGEALITSLRC